MMTPAARTADVKNHSAKEDKINADLDIDEF
jgi:hypothetical protein